MNNRKDTKLGFTLAEVLITLVIIGVIASLTIPTAINSYVERSTVSKVKKGLSILGQAKMLAETQNGPIQDWEFDEGSTAQTAVQFWHYLRPHIQVVHDCGTSSNCYSVDRIYLLNGSIHGFNYSKNSMYYKFVLADGSVMSFRTGTGGKCATSSGSVQNVCAYFIFDVNGDKAPNTWGRDIFEYDMSVTGVFPLTGDTCYKNNSGYGCAGYIIKNSNMNYLH